MLADHRRDAARAGQTTHEISNPRAHIERIRAREEARQKERERIEKEAKIKELESQRKAASGDRAKELADELNVLREEQRTRSEAQKTHTLVKGSSQLTSFMSLLKEKTTSECCVYVNERAKDLRVCAPVVLPRNRALALNSSHLTICFSFR